MTEKKNAGHWDNVFFEINDDAVENNEEKAQKPETPAEETDPVENQAAAEAEPVKPKRGRKAVAKKRTAVKKTVKRAARVPKPIEFLDSPDQIKLDLTVGAEKKTTAGRRGRRKAAVSEAALIEKAEEVERIKATETVRSLIAAQLGGIVQEKESEPAENPIEVKPAEAESAAEPEKAEDDAPFDFFGGEAETLEISWGRPPKSSFFEDPAEESDDAESEEPAVSEQAVSEPEMAFAEKPVAEKSGKISKKDAEALFAQQFNTDAVKEEPARSLNPADNDFWGIPDEPEISFAPKPAKAVKQETAPIQKKEESKPAAENKRSEAPRPGRSRGRREEMPVEETPVSEKEERKPEAADNRRMERPERMDRPERGRRGRWEQTFAESASFAEQEAPVWNDRNKTPEVEQASEPEMASNYNREPNTGRGRRNRDSFDRSNRDQREPVREERPVRSEEERPVRSSNDEIERAFPSWQEAISQVIRFNMDRHKQRQGDHGQRRR